MNPFRSLSDHSTIFQRRDFYELVLAGKIPGYSIVQQNGYNDAVGTTLVPITTTGKYQMETTAKVIEFNSTDPNDTGAGTGAQSLIVEGLDANFEYQTSTRGTQGVSVVNFSHTFTRIFEVRVKHSGSYATATVPSNNGDLILTTTGGGAIWAKITKEGTYGLAQDQIGWRTIPKGFTGFLWSKLVVPDLAATDLKVFFFRRDNCNVITEPFSPMRLVSLKEGVQSPYSPPAAFPKEVFPEYTDLGFMGKVSAGTAKVSVSFEILLIDNNYL